MILATGRPYTTSIFTTTVAKVSCLFIFLIPKFSFFWIGLKFQYVSVHGLMIGTETMQP